MVQQINRAVISIPSNIVEGYGRKTAKDKSHFLNIAYSLMMELICQYEISEALGYISNDELDEVMVSAYRLSVKIINFRLSVLRAEGSKMDVKRLWWVGAKRLLRSRKVASLALRSMDYGHAKKWQSYNWRLLAVTWFQGRATTALRCSAALCDSKAVIFAWQSYTSRLLVTTLPSDINRRNYEYIC